MRALQRQIADVWLATIETDTVLCQQHGVEADAEVVAISTAFAATAVRVLDLEVLQAEHNNAYCNAKQTSANGKVVDGLLLIRNAEIHLPVILDPDVDHMLSLSGGSKQLFRVLPKFRPYAELPTEVQQNKKTAQRCHNAYKETVEGKDVIEVLLDSLLWFLECDPSLVHLDGADELEYFPLRELWEHGYERRHPFWMTRRDYEAQLREEAKRHLPEGHSRTIRHRLVDGEGRTIAYCGQTLSDGRCQVFTEFPAQVLRDLEAGYRYMVDGADGELDVVVVAGEPHVGDAALGVIDLQPFGSESDEAKWRGWFELVSEDPDYYVRQRKV